MDPLEAGLEAREGLAAYQQLLRLGRSEAKRRQEEAASPPSPPSPPPKPSSPKRLRAR